MQLDRFDLWKFTNENNCWEFVRQFLLENTSIHSEHIPKLGILHTDHEAKTEGEKIVSALFIKIDKPQEFAIACSHSGNLLTHVGVCHNGVIRHATYKGALREPIHRFSSKGKTTYYIHRSLCES